MSPSVGTQIEYIDVAHLPKGSASHRTAMPAQAMQEQYLAFVRQTMVGEMIQLLQWNIHRHRQMA